MVQRVKEVLDGFKVSQVQMLNQKQRKEFIAALQGKIEEAAEEDEGKDE